MTKRRVFDVLEWLGRHEFIVLLAVLIVVAGTWGFIALADVVLKGRTQSLDESMLRALRRPDNPAKPIGPDWMVEVGRDVTALGGATVLVLATLAVAGFLLKNLANARVLSPRSGLQSVLQSRTQNPVSSRQCSSPSVRPHKAQLRRELFCLSARGWLDTKTLKGSLALRPLFGWVWFPLERFRGGCCARLELPLMGIAWMWTREVRSCVYEEKTDVWRVLHEKQLPGGAAVGHCLGDLYGR